MLVQRFSNNSGVPRFAPVGEAEVQKILSEGKEIAAYPDDSPYASRPVRGWRDDRPLHVVATYNAQGDEEIVVTVYEPYPALWEDEFTSRKR